MHKKVQKTLFMFLIAIIITTVVTAFNVASADDPPKTKLYTDPPSIVDTEIDPCENFTINIMVANVTDLYTWQIRLLFEPTLLECTKAWIPPDNIFQGLTIVAGPPKIDNDAGYVMFGASILPPPYGVNGSGILGCITFHVKSRGSCALAFTPYGGKYTYLNKYITEPIPDVVVEDGYFENRLAPSPALIFVDPPRIVNLTLVPCENFAINVRIINATYLHSFEFKLGFDPDMLNATDATLGDIFPPVTPTVEINNTAGYVWFSASLEPTQPEVSGNGTLAVITFHVEGLGACDLTMSDTALADSTGEPLPHSTSDGYFNNVLLAKLAVEPPEIIDPTLVPTATFEINITLADVEDLYGYEFNLSFNPDILACLSVKIHNILNETNYTPNFITDNTKGFVWVKVTYFPPAEPITTYPPVTPVTIIFRVKGMGATTLDLHDTSLTDSLGQPIPHEAFDGYVCVLIRDVAVIDVVPSTTETYEGWTVYINVTVRNEGNLTETFDVKCYYGEDNLIETLTVENLPPNEETTLTFTWNTQGVTPCHNYTIWAEAVAVPYETDTTDNIKEDGTVKIKFMGDIDGDGKVNMIDIGIVCEAYGSFPGHPRWNSEADLNGDGYVDMRDIGEICGNYGKTC